MPPTLGTHPHYLEELRLGGGYDSEPDGGADIDGAGNVATNGDLAADGDGTIGGDLNVGGDFTLDGLDTNWRVYLPANLGIPDPSLPCGALAASNWRNFQVVTPSLAFDPDSPQAAFFQFRLPKGYDGRPLNFTLEWSATAGTTGDVRWGVNPLQFDDGSSLIETGTLYFVNDTLIGLNYLHEASALIDALISESGEFVTIRIIRDGSNVLDTFDDSAQLIGIQIELGS